MPLTPEEIAQAEAMEQSMVPAAFNPLRDLSAEDIAALAVQDKNNFVIADEFQRQPELHNDPAYVQKVADAFNLVKQRGFKLEDLPTVPEAGKAVGTAIKGLAGQIWNYANVAGNVVAGAVSELAGAEGLAQGFAENINQRLAENIAGTEEAVTGLSQLAEKGVNKAARTVGASTSLAALTPQERVTDLFNEAGKSEVRSERLTGKGAFTKAVTGEERELDPEKVATLAAGDPLSFFLFGKAAQLGGAAVGAVTPAAVSRAAATAGQAIETASAAAGGRTLQAAGKVAEGAAKATEATGRVVSVAGPIVGSVAALTGADISGAGLGGLLAGTGGVALRKVGQRAAPVAQKISDIGRQVAGATPITSAYAQAGRDILQSLPGAVGEVAKGTALDVGLAAATAELPQDTQGAVGFGTALGALAGAARVGGRVVSGQLIGPREYGVNTVIPSSGQFPALDTMHTDAFKAAPPAIRARLNAVRQFVEGAAPGTDVFLARDGAAVERALIGAGLPPETARVWSQQSGLLTTSLPSKSGQPRRVAIVRDVDAAPHEAFHAVQDVLGEEANRKIDLIVREAYAPQWEAEGQRYADRLGGDAANWRESILDVSGWGLLEAKEKIFRDQYNRVEGETGAAPSTRFIEELAKAELGRVLDEAVQRNPNVDPNLVADHVWRDILTPEEIVGLSDKYIAREIAAENFDALLKNQGPRLQEGTQVPQRLARILGGVISAFGGEPLAGRTSEFGQVALRTPVVEAVRVAALGDRPVVTPAPVAAPRVAFPASTGRPGTPEAVVVNAEEARTIAAEAPEAVPPGGTRSPRELLGEMAEAIASQSGVKINYLSAPSEPAAATTSNRTSRRAIIEAFRTMPAEARSLWEKTFFPERVTRTKAGKYQVQGWAPEVFASNAHKLAEFIAATPDAQILVPYQVDPATRSFTPEAWQQLYVDTQTFVQNQMRGATGSGEALVVPRSVTEAGGFAPPTRPGRVALDQNRADFINMLFNFKLPETPRVQTGRRPLNIIGQEVSVETLPGRVEVPVRPRGEFTGEEAGRQGIEGRQILEVNPLRNQIEAIAQQSGKAMPSFIEVIQKLNLENIKEVQGAPEVPQFRGNTLTLTAGFQPEQQWRVKGQLRGQAQEITVSASDMAAARRQGEARGMRVASVESADKMANAMFQPQELADRVEQFSPDEFRAWVQSVNNNFTQAAYDLGLAAPSREFVNSLKTRYEKIGPKAMVALRASKFDDASAIVSQAQFFREAYEAATGTGSAANRLREQDPNYRAPFAEETPTAQAQPKPSAEVRQLAEDYTGRSLPVRKYATAPEPLLREAADVYQELQHAPEDPAVLASYDALTRETADQYQTMVDAGYVIEPWRETGQPYADSAAMVADVRDNKHLYYFPSTEGYGNVGDAATQNLMLRDSGVVINGESVPFNDLFRAVHDFFGHAKEGYQFGPRGEFNAWGAHSEMYSPEAQGALAAETLAQNAFVNFGPHMRSESGALLKQGDEGFLPVTERPFAEQKNVVVPDEIIERAKAQFAPRKKKAVDNYKLKPPGAGFSKAWILPSGEPVQLGGQWHHQWLSENPEVATKYKLNVPEFEGTDVEGVRESALKAGFARINHAQNTGTLTVEARARDWRKVKGAVERMVESNLDDIDNMTVHLLDETATKTVDSQTARLFNFDDAEKLQHLPFITEGEVRGQFQPRKSEELGAVKTAAIRNRQTGEVTAGETHSDAYHSIGENNTAHNFKVSDWDEGFITNSEEFLNRKQAWDRAVELNQIDPADPRLSYLGILESGDFERQRAQFSPEGELGIDVAPDDRRAQRLIRAQVTKARQQYPEALPLEYRQDESGAFRTDAKGKPIPAGMTYDLGATPLAKQAAKGKRTDAAKDAAIDRAYADEIKATYNEAVKNPAVAAGANWYSLARERLAKLFGEETKFFTELLGATSAQTDVATNFRYAVEAYNNFKQGKYDEQIQKYREGKALWEEGDMGLEPGELSLADVLQEADLGPNPTRAAFMKYWIDKYNLKPRKNNGTLYGANSDAVLKVLDGSWREEVQGPKTPNFAGNLSGDSFEATIDIWAARLLRRLGNKGNEGRWRILPKNEVGVTDNDFYLGQRAFRLAGDELGVSPDALQAMLWFAEKDYWDKRGWTKAAGAEKSDFNTFLDVTTRGYSERTQGPGRVVIDEAALERAAAPVEKTQLDFALE